jgi:hypothetical protein
MGDPRGQFVFAGGNHIARMETVFPRPGRPSLNSVFPRDASSAGGLFSEATDEHEVATEDGVAFYRDS